MLNELLKKAGFLDGTYPDVVTNEESQNPVINPKMPTVPKTPKGSSVKLTTNLGKAKPPYIQKTETKSPYNPN